MDANVWNPYKDAMDAAPFPNSAAKLALNRLFIFRNMPTENML